MRIRPVSAPEETGRTFEENARQKALYYAAATGELTVAEDSGLEIDALGGAPGVESARFGGVETSYPQKFAMLYDALRAAGRDGDEHAARFVCAVALARGERVAVRSARDRRGPDRAGASRAKVDSATTRSSSTRRTIGRWLKSRRRRSQTSAIAARRFGSCASSCSVEQPRRSQRSQRIFLCVLSVLCGFSLRRATPAARCASGARDRAATSSARGRRRSRSAIPRRR